MTTHLLSNCCRAALSALICGATVHNDQRLRYWLMIQRLLADSSMALTPFPGGHRIFRSAAAQWPALYQEKWRDWHHLMLTPDMPLVLRPCQRCGNYISRTCTAALQKVECIQNDPPHQTRRVLFHAGQPRHGCFKCLTSQGVQSITQSLPPLHQNGIDLVPVWVEWCRPNSSSSSASSFTKASRAWPSTGPAQLRPRAHAHHPSRTRACENVQRLH